MRSVFIPCLALVASTCSASTTEVPATDVPTEDVTTTAPPAAWYDAYLAASYDDPAQIRYVGGLVADALSALPATRYSTEILQALDAFRLEYQESLEDIEAEGVVERIEPFESVVTAMTLIEPSRSKRESDQELRQLLAVHILQHAVDSEDEVLWIYEFCIAESAPFIGIQCDALADAVKVFHAWASVRDEPEMRTLISRIEGFSSRVSTNFELIDALTAITTAVMEFIEGDVSGEHIVRAASDDHELVKYPEDEMAPTTSV